MNLQNLLRSFTIRTRMLGAILMVIGLFILVGATALWGGALLLFVLCFAAGFHLRAGELAAELRVKHPLIASDSTDVVVSNCVLKLVEGVMVDLQHAGIKDPPLPAEPFPAAPIPVPALFGLE